MRFIFSIIVITVMSISSAFGASCANDEEKVAIDLRTLQSHLMVAALSCGEQTNYNEFARRFTATYSKYGKNLQAYFKRTHPTSHKMQMNRFVTNLANTLSSRSLSLDEEHFCKDISKLFTQVLAFDEKKLVAHTRKANLTDVNDIPACGTKYTSR